MNKLQYFRSSPRLTTRAILAGIAFEEHDITPDNVGKIRFTLDLLRAPLGRGDILLCDSWGYKALAIIAVKHLKKYKAIIRLRGDPYIALYQSKSWSNRFKKWFMKYLLENSDLVVFNSRHVLEQPAYNFLNGKAEVVYNPLMMDHSDIDPKDLELERQVSQVFKILSVTNFDYPQKIQPLINAINSWVDWEFLKENNIEWSIVGGNGILVEEFKSRLLAELPHSRLILHGHSDDVAEFYRSHHVFAHMSGLDSLPNVILEAAINGLPVITIPTSGGTLEAMKDRHTGRIVDSAETFREAILNYRNSPQLRREHGRNGKEMVLENFTAKKQQKRFEEIFEKNFNGEAAQDPVMRREREG